MLLLAVLGAACDPQADPDRTPDELDTGGDDLPCDDPQTFYRDADEDTYGVDDDTRVACQRPIGWAERAGDCDDDDAGVFPGAIEECDGVDRDCNGVIDDNPATPLAWHRDADEDGYGSVLDVVYSCLRPGGHVSPNRGTDCDDTDPTVHPGAEDAPCDGIDQDCSGDSPTQAAQLHGQTWPALSIALELAEEDDTVYACEGTHPLSASIDHSLRLVGVGGPEAVVLESTGGRVLQARGDVVDISGVTLRGGTGDGDGGAALVHARVFRLTDVVIVDSVARLRGGAVHAEIADDDSFEVTFDGVVARQNRAGTDGGAISLRLLNGGFATLDQVRLEANRAGRDGGGVIVTGTDRTQVLVLQDFTGRDNHAGNRGGHVMLYGRIHAILRGRDVDIRGGSAVEGGLVALDAPEDGKLDFYRCNLHDGQASTAGGLIHHSGRFTLDNTLSECDLSRGIAPEGGLLWVQTGSTGHLSWTDTTLHHGRADAGSALFLTGNGTPFDGALDGVVIRDNDGGPALQVDPDYKGGDGVDFEISDGALLRNQAGAIDVPGFITTTLDGVDTGSGVDENTSFDLRSGGTAFTWEGVATTTCSSGSCE